MTTRQEISLYIVLALLGAVGVVCAFTGNTRAAWGSILAVIGIAAVAHQTFNHHREDEE